MSENFKADTAQIAGLGNLVTDIGKDVNNIAVFAGTHIRPASEGFTGQIISDLRSPLDEMANEMYSRIYAMGTYNISTGAELNKAAWMYFDQDQRNYAALNAHTEGGSGGESADTERLGQTEAFTGAANYPKPEEISLTPPEANREELASLITEVFPEMGAINESIKDVTRMAGKEVDPLVLVLKPIEGNWNEIRRIGEAAKIAGVAMEASGKNLENGVKLVGPHWDGKAAIAFESNWANKQVEALKWHGPVGRIIADVTGKLSDKIRDGIRAALETLKKMILDYIDVKSVKGIFKNVIKRVPGVGWCVEVADLANKIYTIVTEVREIVRKIEEVKNTLKEFLSFATNPLGVATTTLEQKLEPYLYKAAVANDLAFVAQVNKYADRPNTSYDVGAGAQPWDNE